MKKTAAIMNEKDTYLQKYVLFWSLSLLLLLLLSLGRQTIDVIDLL